MHVEFWAVGGVTMHRKKDLQLKKFWQLPDR